ncbi:glycine--tRNA ligase, partial [SAR202 cluster bacterium AD-802-E10_MRT_200m]|nr:glycine--tRNA ligase [SAR202 cluster bacterium AD-802-E10_MRT_200m]
HFPWGWGELEGIANRTDFDLRRHTNMSGERLVVFDEETNTHISPYIIEPSGGVDRATLTFLMDSYREEEITTNSGKTEIRTLLKLNPALAPIKAAVLPLSRNATITPLALNIAHKLRTSTSWNIEYDDSQSIGRRYRRFDEIGTPICITVDFETLSDEQVTIRDRDTMQQTRIPISQLESELRDRLDNAPVRTEK